MEERKCTIESSEYIRVASRMGFYLKNKNNRGKYKDKSALFAGAGGTKGRIELISHNLKHMGSLIGHHSIIRCLCSQSNRILVSGSADSNIKIRDIEERALITTLYGHTGWVTAICDISLGDTQLVSGRPDFSLIIWAKLSGSPLYSLRDMLIGHTSEIRGIVKINNAEIISGEWNGDLRIWDLPSGLCTRHIPKDKYIYEMKPLHEGEVAVDYLHRVKVWGAGEILLNN